MGSLISKDLSIKSSTILLLVKVWYTDGDYITQKGDTK